MYIYIAYKGKNKEQKITYIIKSQITVKILIKISLASNLPWSPPVCFSSAKVTDMNQYAQHKNLFMGVSIYIFIFLKYINII